MIRLHSWGCHQEIPGVMWTVQFETMIVRHCSVHNLYLTLGVLCDDDCYQAMVNGQLRQCWGTLPRVEAHNMLSSIHHKYCNYTTSNEWLTSPTAIALPGRCIIPPSLLSEFYLDFIEEQTFANVDCVGAIYLMTVVTSCCWCPPVVADFRTGRMDNASFTLTSFVSTLQQCSSSTGYNQVHIIWATAKMLK